ncbi:MAG: aquaporin family protein [Sediminibacterium sp.]|jgi:glycerol uptake facilitator protein|nr:aquaporin family protein [Sediminibacterium sp.]
MTPFVAEFLGTAFIIIIGNGVVANVVLPKTKGNNGGLISIVLGWMIAVFVGVYMTADSSGAHLNPAVTFALAAAGKFDWSMVPMYILAQMLGAMFGAFIVWMIYKDHINEAGSAADQLAIFSTGPSIRRLPQNFITETLATLVFILGILFIQPADNNLGALSALPVALLVGGIGFGLGGPTGWAINPARDLGPRMMHFLLPMKGKGSSDWSYAPVPVFGPIVGGILAGIIYTQFLQ